MKAIMMSIKPKWVAKILNGEKTIEIRRTMPKCELPIDVYIYCTEGKPCLTKSNETKTGLLDLNGKVVAKFTLHKVEPIAQYDGNEERYFTKSLWETELFDKSCLSLEEMRDYIHNHFGYTWRIDNLVIFDKPKEISEFMKVSCKGCPFENTQTCHNNIDGRYCKLTRAPQSYQFIEI